MPLKPHPTDPNKMVYVKQEYGDIISDGGYDPRNAAEYHKKKEWVGLTDEELNLIYAAPQTHIGQYARAIEAKLKEKNNG